MYAPDVAGFKGTTTMPKTIKQTQALTLPGEADKLTTFNVETLIAKAIEQKVPVETMERILAMRRELKSEYAKEQFDRSLAAFQSECPVIEKTKVVKNKDGTVRYKYAPIESIVSQVKGLLEKHGFSYTIDTKTNGSVTAITKVTHYFGPFINQRI